MTTGTYIFCHSLAANLCIYESRYKDADTKIEIKRTVSPGGSTIATESLYENGRGTQEHRGTVLLCRKKITIAQQNRPLVLLNDKYPKINVVVKHLKPKGTIRGIYYETNLYDPFRLDELHNYYIINGTLVITSPEDVEIAKKIENDFMSEFFQLALGTKADIKQVSSVAKSLKMTPNQAAMFKQEIEYLKKSVGKKNNMNFSYKELIEIGKEIIDMFK